MTTWVLVIGWLGAAMVRADDAAKSGGEGTIFHGGSESFGRVLANASAETRRKFLVGNSFFTDSWQPPSAEQSVRSGLGPQYHATACAGCHLRDGRGGPPISPVWAGEPGLLLRISVPGTDEHGGPLPEPTYGLQLSPLAVAPAEPEIEARLTWKEAPGAYADGVPYSLRRPEVEVTRFRQGPPAASKLLGLRLAPAVFGLGLLEAIDEQEVLAQKGKANFVWDAETNSRRLGRFGWKANVADLRQQTILAFAEDLGITTTSHPPEISETLLRRVVTYVRALAVPARRDLEMPEVQRGEAVFRQLNCATCHRETFTTGTSPELPELSHQIIHPYTDLLLHDLGEGLADHRPDYLASGSEWRTPPLWGLGLHELVNSQTNLLHDGRARSLAEAILWHGGEAQGTAEAFRALSATQRRELLSFLRSL